jgi:hypothetical protein
MGWIKIHRYFLEYNAKVEKAVVGIEYRKGGAESGELLSYRISPSSGDAVFLADLLRHEQPVYFDPDKELIITAEEPPGDVERPL